MLHPVVVYYASEKDHQKLDHRSFAIVSDEMSHSSTTVHAILNKIVPLLKQMNPQTEMIHYWTDGATSQYRNKQILLTVANHKEIYGMSFRWNYFEVGYGKGPCDGLGGTTKKIADEAVRSGRAVIQDATDFFKWAVGSSLKAITFLFVSVEDCVSAAAMLKDRDVKPLSGTFKLHAVIGNGNAEVIWNEVSWYCQQCLKNENPELTHGWKKQTSAAKKQINAQTISEVDDNRIIDNSEDDNTRGQEHQVAVDLDLNEGDWVAVLYDRKWHAGQIKGIDSDNEL